MPMTPTLRKRMEELAKSFAKHWAKPSPEKAEFEALSYSYEQGFSAGHAFAMQECSENVAVLIDAIEDRLQSDKEYFHENTCLKTMGCYCALTELDKALTTFKSNNQAGEQGGEG